MKNIFRLFPIYIVYVSLWTNIFGQSGRPDLLIPLNQSEFQRSKNLEFKWDEIPSVYSYRFELSTDSSFINPLVIIDVMGNSMIIDLLDYNTTYYWRVREISDTLWSEKWSFKTTSEPVIPLLYAPENNLRNQPDTMYFAWNSEEVNSSYLLQFSFYSDFRTIEKNVYVNDTTFSLPSLFYNHYYYWRVKSLNANFEESQWSEIRHFKTRLETAFSLNSDSLRNVDSAYTLRWTTIDSASYYAIRLSTDRSLLDKTDPIIVSKNPYLFDSLDNNKWYYWQVLAFNSFGDSSNWSSVYSFKTKLQNVVLFSPLKALRNTDTTITFNWQTVQFAERYRFQLALDQQFTKMITDTILKTIGIRIDSLEYAKTYFWRIDAYNKEKDSSKWSEVFNFRTRLNTPTIISPVYDTTDVPVNVDFQWTLSDAATRYHIQISNEPQFYYPALDTSITRNSYKINKLIPDTIYYWRVEAYNALKDSSLWTPIQKFRTVAAIRILTDSIKTVKNLSEEPSDTLGYISIENSGINNFNFESIYLKPDSLFYLANSSLKVLPGTAEKYWVRINSEKIPAGISTLNINLIRNNIENLPDTMHLVKAITIRKAVAKMSADTVIFRNTSALDSSLQKLFIKNIKSNLPLKIKKIYIKGADTLSFKISNVANNVPANDSLPLNLWFAPDHKGVNNTHLHIETNSFPVRNFDILLLGIGKGGELAEETYNSIKAFAADSFETFTDNSRKIFFHNIGNDFLNLSLRFKRDYFKTIYDFQKDIQLKPGDTLTVGIKYNMPNFRRSNTDTMVITHKGFGKDTIFSALKGSFDSTASSRKVVNELLVNNENYSGYSKFLEKNSLLVFSYNPKLFTGIPNVMLRLKYYKGGNGSLYVIDKDNTNTYIVPRDHISELGLIVWAELIIRNNQKITDSITVLSPADFQVILRKYKTKSLSVPRSIPGEDKESAKTKWVMFGFPFHEIAADSVFGYFGGIQHQKDAEWIIYDYNPQASSQFSVFSNFAFEPQKGYFFAQSLLDTFKITYNYVNNVATRKLTDTIISVQGDGWKTVSNPFLFDVEVDNSISLSKYDLNYNSYRLTNIMKPGEAYFVEPGINKIRVKTFGKYNPLIYPGKLNNLDWHLKITASGSKSVNEIFVSLNTTKLTKENIANHHAFPPSLDSDFEFYIKNSYDDKLQLSIINGKEGAVWDLVIRSRSAQDIILKQELFGKFPELFNYKIYDTGRKTFIYSNQIFSLNKSQEYLFKIIIGTEQFINKTIHSLNEIPEHFSLSQNYPNPFNSSTKITYTIPSADNLTSVKLKLYDILGREVATIVDEYQTGGKYEVRIDLPLSTGIYIYKLSAGNYSESRKMLLLK